MRKRSVLLLFVVALSVALMPAGSALAARGQSTPVRLSGDLDCFEEGSEITFSIENLGKQTVVLDGDFHLFFSEVRPGVGQVPVGALFVFPAPGFNTIEPGGEATFILPVDSQEPDGGEETTAKRLIVGAEVFIVGREKPITRHFSFPTCE